MAADENIIKIFKISVYKGYYAKDIYLEKNCGPLITDILQGNKVTLCSLDNVLLAYRQIEGSTRESVTSEDGGDSLGGSPLKLQQFDVGSPVIHSHGENKALVKPMGVVDARHLLSLYHLSGSDRETSPVLCVYCECSPPEHLLFLGSHVVRKQDAIHNITYKVTSTGPYSYNKKESLPKVSSLISKHFPVNSKVESRCDAEFDTFSLGKDFSMLQQQGSLKVKLEWDKVTNLLQNPPLDASTVVEASVSPRDNRSRAHYMYTELLILQGFVRGLTEGVVEWAVGNEEMATIPRLHQIIKEQGDYREKGVAATKSSGEEEELHSPAKNLLLIHRKNLDFTEQLWGILKDSSSARNLTEGLELVLDNLRTGQIQPMVHKSNQCTLARLIRDSYYGKMEAPPLEGTLPVQILVEIGMEKLHRDYTNAFIGKELVTDIHLEGFLHASGDYSQMLEGLRKLHHSLEYVVMLEQYLTLPPASLGKAARQALSHFENNAVDEDYVFKLPVKTSDVSGVFERVQPSVWRVELCGVVEGHQLTTTCILTPRPLSCNLQGDTTHADIDDDSLSYNLITESQTVVVL